MLNKNNILYIVILIMFSFILVREGCNSSQTNQLLKSVSDYKTEAKHYKTLNGAEVAQNKALLLENQEQIKSLLNKNDTLTEIMKAYKKLQSVTIMNNTTEIRHDSIAYDTIRIPCDFEPFQVVRDSSHYKFHATIAPSYLKIDSLLIPDEQSITFGLKKNGFLKRSEYTAEVIHSNPLVRTTNIGQYSVKEKRKKIVVSIGGGYGVGLSDMKMQPHLSIHAGFPIISF